MPKTLNPNNNFPTSITNFPISGNNEPIAIEPLEAAIQAVLDRTENLHQSRLMVEGVGVKRIRQFASRSALSAASGFADGDIVSVDGYGLYRLFTSSGAAADGLWVLTASGGGRWIHIENDLKGANGGLATLDSAGRLSQDVRDGSIATAHLVNSSVTGVKLAPGAALANLGYIPINKGGDTMNGRLNINAERLFNVSVDQGNDTTTRYYYLGRIHNNNGMLKVQGILGGHVGGRANIDLQFSVRNGLQANGYIIGTVSDADIIVLDGGDSWHYVYLVTNQFALVNLELSKTTTADLTFNGTYQTTMPGGTLVYQLSTDFTSNTHPYTLKLKSGSILGRYDHQDRFVFSSNAGFSSSLAAGNVIYLATFPVYIPSRKSLYLRRARYYLSNPSLRLQVGDTSTFTSNNNIDDVTPGAIMSSTSGLRSVGVLIYNPTGSTQNMFPSDSCWLEFEIV